jgi:2-oxoglutarate ferredoxin oxidoreductase subunit alpha
LGTIQPSQADYFQTVNGGGHGDYRLITLAPASVQEMADHVALGFDLSFKYNNTAMILTDGVIGQMMEKVVLPEQRPRRTEADIRREQPWAALGKPDSRGPNIVTSLELDSALMEQNNLRFQTKYQTIEDNEVRYETIDCADADYLIVAFGSAARISQKVVASARQQGIRAGLFRPITLWPFPAEVLRAYKEKIKGILVVELNAGQMIEDVRLAVDCHIPVAHYGRLGGIVPTPQEVLEALQALRTSCLSVNC